MILRPRMLLIALAFMRWTVHRPMMTFGLRAHRSTPALRRLRIIPPRTITLWTIHRWPTEAIAPALVLIAIAHARRVHLFRSAIARPTHFRATRWGRCVVRKGTIALPTLLRGGLLGPSRRWGVRFRGDRRRRHCGGRWLCRLGFLGVQGYDVENERTAKPGDWVGFEFHTRRLLRLTATGETLVGMKSCASSVATEESRLLYSKALSSPQHRPGPGLRAFQAPNWRE